jgi:hypothetical protein
LRRQVSALRLHPMPDPLIERAEVVALLFNVSDIASALERIERLLVEDDGEEEADEG